MMSYVFWHENERIHGSEYSGIFRVKLVTKIVVLGSPGTHFMHMSVKTVFQLLAVTLWFLSKLRCFTWLKKIDFMDQYLS